MFTVVLCDSLLCAHKSRGVAMHSLQDGHETLQACLCIASGGSLIMGGGRSCADSALGLASNAFKTNSRIRRLLADDPQVCIIVLNAARSTAKCRGREQFPYVVQERHMCPLVKQFETRWTICDLEDVVQQRPDRTRWPELERCQLRSSAGIYGQKGDDLHFRKDVAVAAGDELVKALRRTALSRYGADLLERGLLLVLAAGWNTNNSCFSALSSTGHAWRKAELVATAELCALSGHPVSAVLAKVDDLVRRSGGDHAEFLLQRVASLQAIRPPDPAGHTRAVRRRWANEALQEEEQATKRRRAVMFIAEACRTSADVARGMLDEAAGDVAAAMELPSARAALCSPPAPAASLLAGCAGEVWEVSDSDEEHAAGLPSAGMAREAAQGRSPVQENHGQGVLQLVSMGFERSRALSALQACDGQVARAVEYLVL